MQFSSIMLQPARQQIANDSEKLDKIRKFRSVHESHVSQEPIRTRILQLIEDSLETSADGDEGWGIKNANIRRICADHMPDVMNLPRVRTLIGERKEMQWGKQPKHMKQLWKNEWPAIRDEIGYLRNDCMSAARLY